MCCRVFSVTARWRWRLEGISLSKESHDAYAHPPHPGEILHDLWLEPLGLTITAAAKQLKVSRKALSELVNGHSGITPEMAMRLELALGKSAESWLGHQSAHDLWQMHDRVPLLGVERFALAT